MNSIQIARRREALSRDVRLALLGPGSNKPKLVEFETCIRALMRRLEIPMDSKAIRSGY